MQDDTQPETAPHYEPGDCVAVELGEIRLRNGTTVQGVVLTFPAGPPSLPISWVWDGTPLTLAIKPSKDARPASHETE